MSRIKLVVLMIIFISFLLFANCNYVTVKSIDQNILYDIDDRVAYHQEGNVSFTHFGSLGFDEVYSVINTSDGGYILAGYTTSYGTIGGDMLLIKISANGFVTWYKTYGGNYSDSGNSVVATADGGYALAGYTNSYGSGSSDMWLVKTDIFGHAEWNRTYGGLKSDGACSIIATSDGGYALAGSTWSYGNDSDIWLVKTNISGHVEWNKTYGGFKSDGARAIIATSDGGYAIAGYTNSSGPTNSRDMWLVKTNDIGQVIWNRTYGGKSWDSANSIVATADGGYALVGYSYSYGSTTSNMWLVKTNGTGHHEWNRTFGGTLSQFPLLIEARSIIVTSDKGYVLAGHSLLFGRNDLDMCLIKTNSTGHAEWNQTFGGEELEKAYSVIATADGGYALAGSTHSYGDNGDICFIITTFQENLNHNPYKKTSNPISVNFTYLLFSFLMYTVYFRRKRDTDKSES